MGVLAGIGAAWLFLPFKTTEFVAVYTPPPSAPPPAHITLRDYLQIGRDRLETFLQEHSNSDLAEFEAGAQVATVRVRFYFDSEAGEPHVNYGSGVLLENSRLVATAAHVLPPAALAPSARCEIIIFSGTSMDAVIVERGKEEEGQDWALLSISGSPSYVPEGLPLGKIAGPAGRILAFGYPGEYGVLGSRTVGSSSLERPRWMLPLGIAAEAKSGTPSAAFMFAPVAGITVLEGMSGGPVVDTEGRVVAILTQAVNLRDPSGHVHESVRVEHRLVVTPLQPAFDRIAELIKEGGKSSKGKAGDESPK